MATFRNPIGQFLRNRLIRLVGQFSSFRHNFVRTLSEMSIHYPNSPLNGESGTMNWASKSVHPGDRVPDTRLRDPRTSREQRLLLLLRSPQFNLLLLPAGPDRVLSEIRRHPKECRIGVSRHDSRSSDCAKRLAAARDRGVCVHLAGFHRLRPASSGRTGNSIGASSAGWLFGVSRSTGFVGRTAQDTWIVSGWLAATQGDARAMPALPFGSRLTKCFFIPPLCPENSAATAVPQRSKSSPDETARRAAAKCGAARP